MKEKYSNKEKKLKVLQVAPIALPISNNLKYAGTERVIYNQDAGLVEKGIESLVAASADSNIKGKLLPTIEMGIFDYSEGLSEIKEKYSEHIEKTKKYIELENPDIIHDHDASFILNANQYLNKLNKPFVSTFHSSVIGDGMREQWSSVPKDFLARTKLVAISESQRNLLKESLGLSVDRVIYHGLDLSQFPYTENRRDYLLSVGKIAPEKGQDLAIEVAKDLGYSLIIAGPVQEWVDKNVDFYNNKLKANIDFDFSNSDMSVCDVIELAEIYKGKIFYVGNVNGIQRNILNKYAKAFLNALGWTEGFGLVMTEAMSCGNPVIAFNKGSVPEIVREGFNGYIVENVDEMKERVGRIGEIKPRNCRKSIEDKFTLKKQVSDYISVYEEAIRDY
jgi:glycosyltransferase involved in cell wall biosynthesis